MMTTMDSDDDDDDDDDDARIVTEKGKNGVGFLEQYLIRNLWLLLYIVFTL